MKLIRLTYRTYNYGESQISALIVNEKEVEKSSVILSSVLN